MALADEIQETRQMIWSIMMALADEIQETRQMIWSIMMALADTPYHLSCLLYFVC